MTESDQPGPAEGGEAAAAVDDAARQLLTAFRAGTPPGRGEQRSVVRGLLDRLASVAHGRSVEVRVPPLAAVQVGTEGRHRRGTPPAVVECDPRTWLELAVGDLAWDEAVTTGQVRASGEGSDLSAYLPLTGASRHAPGPPGEPTSGRGA